jgi:hypothetical protein
MESNPALSGSDLRTYEKLFQHPLSHNLEWHDVQTMLGRLGQIHVEPNGHISFARNGHALVLHRPHTKDITDMHELMEIRHFLERSETEMPPVMANGHVTVFVSRQEARVFHSDAHDTAATRVRPADPLGPGHSAESHDFSRGKDIPPPVRFFELIAAEIKEAQQILLFGCGSGKASEAELFAAWLREQHPALATRIAGTIAVDEHQVSDNELLAKTRHFLKIPSTS